MTIYAFMIHSSENIGSVHFSQFYTGEGNDHAKATRLQTIVRKVMEDKSFQQHSTAHFPTRLDMRSIPQSALSTLTTTKKLADYYSTIPADTSTIPPPLEGVALIPESGIFETGKAAIWRIFGDMLFTIVCDARDNLTLVSNTTTLIVEHLCRRFGQSKLQQRVVSEPEEVETVVGSYLKLGSPLMVNYSLHRYMALSEENSRPYID